MTSIAGYSVCLKFRVPSEFSTLTFNVTYLALDVHGNGFRQRFFYWRNFGRRRIFFTCGLFLAKFGPKKNILVAKNSSILTIFHPFEPIFIQHLDELVSGYVLVVPPGRKTKNHRKNIGFKGRVISQNCVFLLSCVK
jgi:hypothetical protein